MISKLKAICIQRLQDYVSAFQERRTQVTEEVVREFMAVRKLEWNGNPNVPRADLVVPVNQPEQGGAEATEGDGKMTKNQLKKLLKEQQIAQKKADKAKEKAAAKGPE